MHMNPPPTERVLASFYDGPYWEETNSIRTKVYRLQKQFRRAIYFSKELERLGVGKGGRLLEIGSGFGGVAWALGQLRSLKPFAIELDPAACLFQEALGVQVIDAADVGATAQEEALFDVVLLSHVLEHVTDPHKLLAQAFSMVKPTGVVLVEVPHGHFVFDGGLEHPFVYTRRSLNRLIQRFSSNVLFRVHGGLENVALPPKYLFALARPLGRRRQAIKVFPTPPLVSVFLQRLMTSLRNFGPLRGLNFRLAARLRESVTLQEGALFAALPVQVQVWLDEPD